MTETATGQQQPEILHQDHAPVMMIGHGSSGTSILGEILRDDFKIAFGTESQFFVYYYRRLDRYGDLKQPENLRQLAEHVLAERWFEKAKRKWDFSLSLEDLLDRTCSPTFRGLLDAIFVSFQHHLGMERYGDKSPEYTLDLAVLGELYPDAKYIHMVRDGRDVAVSLFKRYWGGKNIYTVSRRWKKEVDLVDQFVATLPADRVLEVTYEGLLGSPEEQMDRLVDFLAIEDPDGSVREALRTQIPLKLNRGNFDKWRKQLSQKQRVAFETVACETLRRHGYETIVDNEQIDNSLAKQLFFGLDNRVRKWAYIDYWKDNAYKAKLRLRNMSRRLKSS
ncbi:sulfotransferase family protein [Rhodopirellula sp. MGV]|uniref:sulfotransferase family protein n=1 Tax=Rhodopirellula sp. MGV TaxID=2023130 RepID=UPI000B963169|nr:sulfotransferase [Rhodopirellula sp. MGV]OYP33013.1 hypothetical protein CGZ80_19180 [Rhodopirellula sp. MGV]PNY35325.1 sulfotransferase [Rhodopirellula baltica]